MNRLVIVGNGFDLAHGLPTGYCDFIDWYWGEVIKNLKKIDIHTGGSFEDNILRISFKFRRREFYSQEPKLQKEISLIDSYGKLCSFISDHKIMPSGNSLDMMVESDNCKMGFSNNFFEVINSKRSIQNWVDIENEYYKLLKECLVEEDNDKVKKLNEEFELIKDMLKKYLDEGVNKKFIFKTNESVGEIAKFFEKTHLNQKNLFLNFNYTETVDVYIKAFGGNMDMKDYGETKQIQIHGRLNDKLNEINFGFGDEMDEDYKSIEKKDDNEYLKNIKSFQYLQNSNYKDMLEFVESDEFQVFIMGHSCGLSDRILLNKIFEHHNCRSIKVFYYKNGEWDNYTEIVQNISRHFNKKEMMREKIVNKLLCQPLPQNIRFAKKENGPQ